MLTLVLVAGISILLLAACAVNWLLRYRSRRVQVFLSYRVASDQPLVAQLYQLLVERGVRVWWDKECLEDGQQWAPAFAAGLISSQVFLPVMSQEALANFARLDSGSACDNVLLEYLLALEQVTRRKMLAIFPIFVGPLDADTGEHTNFFAAGALPSCTSNAAINLVDSSAREYLSNAYGMLKGGLLVEDRSAGGVLKQIIGYQGGFVQGDQEASLILIADRIATMCKKQSRYSAAAEGEDGGRLPQGGSMCEQEGVALTAVVTADGRRVSSDTAATARSRAPSPRWTVLWRRLNFVSRQRARAPMSVREHRDDLAMLPPPPNTRRARHWWPQSSAAAEMKDGAPHLLRGFLGGQTAASGEESGTELRANPILMHQMTEQTAQDRKMRGLSGAAPSSGLRLLLGRSPAESSAPVDVERDKFKRLSYWLQAKGHVDAVPANPKRGGNSGSGSSADANQVSRAAEEARERFSLTAEQNLKVVRQAQNARR